MQQNGTVALLTCRLMAPTCRVLAQRAHHRLRRSSSVPKLAYLRLQSSHFVGPDLDFLLTPSLEVYSESDFGLLCGAGGSKLPIGFPWETDASTPIALAVAPTCSPALPMASALTVAMGVTVISIALECGSGVGAAGSWMAVAVTSAATTAGSADAITGTADAEASISTPTAGSADSMCMGATSSSSSNLCLLRSRSSIEPCMVVRSLMCHSIPSRQRLLLRSRPRAGWLSWLPIANDSAGRTVSWCRWNEVDLVAGRLAVRSLGAGFSGRQLLIRLIRLLCADRESSTVHKFLENEISFSTVYTNLLPFTIVYYFTPTSSHDLRADTIPLSIYSCL